MSQVILRQGKEKAILNRHHWIFSGAVSYLPPCESGELLPVVSHKGTLLGTAYFNPRCNIIGRMLSFDTTPALQTLKERLGQALAFRKKIFDSQTTGYRLVHGEGDLLPGLIIDRYGDCLVMQVATAGMERLKGEIVEWLLHHLQPRIIYEKSESSSRKEEGLPPFSGFLYGSDPTPIQIKENGIVFNVDFQKGQKTGFFCDQREMRRLVRSFSQGKSVLNCFAYSGGFTVNALAGGALRADSVEISAEAVNMIRHNLQLNGFSEKNGRLFQEDVFTFLREQPLDYDLVILDPPAFAKKQKDLIAACRGYKEINRIALKRMPPGSSLLTCSCSHFIDEPLFQKLLFQSAVEAGRKVRIVGRHLMAADHPLNICHPENEYLKSLLLYVE